MTQIGQAEPDLKNLFSRIEQMQSAIPSEAADAASDYELVIIFTDEACDLLDQAQDSLRAWAQAPLDVHHPRALKRLFHTLKGSARTAQAPGIGEIAELIETQVALYGDNGQPPPPEFLQRMEQVVEGMYDLIDRFRTGERALPIAPLVATLQGGGVAPPAAKPPSLPVEKPPSLPVAKPPPVAKSPPLPVAPVAEAEEVTLDMPAPAEPEDFQEIEMPPPPQAEAVEEISLEMPPPAADGMEAAMPAGEVPDPELVDIFAGEAQDLIEEIDQQLSRWEIDPLGVQPRRELLRSLHTLKGSARMAHVQAMGDLSHELESQIGAVDVGRRQADATFFAGLRNAADAMHDMLDRIQRGDTQVDASAIIADLRGETVTPSTAPVVAPPPPPPPPPLSPPPPPVAVTPATPPVPPPPASVAPPPVVPMAAPATPPPALEIPEPVYAPVVPIAPLPIDTGPWAPALFIGPASADARAAQSEMARIAVEQLDSMLNEAGEISIYRSRLEQQNTSLQFQLNEMLQTISRIRGQVHGLDTEAQAMIVARQQGQAGTDPDRYQQEFDPLEMDRFSRLQEMSRSLAESMTDLESVRDVLDELRGQNEMLLLQQARVNSELQQKLMRSLMVPFARQVQRLERIVRQTAQEYGKKARVEFAGVESELDRNVLE
ncbi:MAG: Hpt domain-containing protein, partial [Nevskiales bacterium]